MSVSSVSQSEAVLSVIGEKCPDTIGRAKTFGRDVTVKNLRVKCTCKSFDVLCVSVNRKLPGRGTNNIYIHVCANPECNQTKETPEEEKHAFTCPLCNPR